MSAHRTCQLAPQIVGQTIRVLEWNVDPREAALTGDQHRLVSSKERREVFSKGPNARHAHRGLLHAKAEAGGTLARLRRNGAAWQSTVKAVEKVVKEQPLWKLQTVGDERLDFLYANVDSGSEITLKPGVAYCLRAFHGLVTELVRAAWLRYVRRHNQVLGDPADLAAFLFGTERGDLSQMAVLLRDVQHDRCFYCEGDLRRGGEVDHFVPWSRYPLDLGHNFVLAHRACNHDKSDVLAAVVHLERWCERNASAGADLAGTFDDLGALHDLPSSLRVASWSYSQAEATGSRLWLRRKELVPFDPAWVTLPGLAG